MKKKYVAPSMEVVEMQTENLIAASGSSLNLDTDAYNEDTQMWSKKGVWDRSNWMEYRHSSPSAIQKVRPRESPRGRIFFGRPPRREQRDAGTPDKKHATPFAGKRKKGYLCGVWRCGAHGNL